MANLKNSCHFEGRIYDPKFSTITAGGKETKKVQFKLIVNKRLTKEQREKAKNDSSIKTSEFVPMSALGGTAEFIESWLPAGRAAIVEATYTTYDYTDSKSGEKAYGHIFNVNDIDFVATSKEDAGSNGSSNSSSSSNSNKSSGGFNMFEESSDEKAPW